MKKTHKTEDTEEKIVKENIQKRFKTMFSGQGEPLSNMSLHEVEALKERVIELETKLAHQTPTGSQGPLTSHREVFKRTETSNQQDISIKEPASIEVRQKQIALWIAAIFTAVSLSFFGFSLYTLLVSQAGQVDLTDIVLMPATVLMAIFNLVSLRLIHRDRPILGRWMIYLVNTIPLPILAVLSTKNIYVLSSGYLIIFSLLCISLIIPRSSTWRAMMIAAGGLFVVTAIELLNPVFRVGTHHLDVFTPVMVGLALLAVFAFIIGRATAGNIRTKLIVATVIMSVLSVGVVAFSAQRSLSTNLTQNIGSSLVELANSKAIEIGQAMDRESDILKTLALSKDIREAAATANEAGLLNQAEIIRLDKQWQAVVEGSSNDPLILSVLDNYTSNELLQFQKEFPQHVEVFLTNAQGVNIAATNRTSDYYQGDEEWWQTAYQEGLYVGQPTYDESSKTLALIMATAVHEPASGKFLGVLRTTVNFSTLYESLLAGQFGQTGHTGIYLPTGEEIKLEKGEDGNFELVIKDAEIDIMLLIQSPESYTEVLHDGVPSLAALTMVTILSDEEEDVKAIRNLNWNIVALQERSEALQPVTIQTRNNLFLVVVITIAVIISTLILGRVITNPIVHLKAVAEKIAAGDLTIEAKVETKDEVGTLAATFNHMTSQLRSLVGSLEQRVQDRTHDLELASEVGRTITEKVSDETEMLRAAAEMIRSRFELYYTQVYLTDAAGQKLLLRAGTGDVGQELLSRKHYLLINSSSLNGQAVLENKAIIVADTQQNPNFKPNALLPKTRSEMAVPLISGDRVIGVLDMQSEQPGVFNETNLTAFEALAGQLAIAIENAALFAQVEEARADVEAQMQRLTEQGWQDFLNAVEHGQKIGYAFDQSKVIRLQPDALLTSSEDRDLNIPITVTGTKIGEIQLPTERDQIWTDNELELIRAISAQLAQHVENLRLLAQAESYRAEAEKAVQRLTHEGWHSFLQSHNELASSYLFDLTEVKPLAEKSNGHSAYAVKHPMVVGNQIIGELAVDAPHQSDEADEVIAAVAEQLSGHIENLRLSELNEKHAQREQTLRQITSALRSSTNPVTIMRTAVRELGTILGRRTVVQLAKLQSNNQAESVVRNENETGATAHES